ncbi:MAG: T9SS type A sorting domain-containing protein, partial [Candidatus Cloacimonadota bacterium]
TIYDVSGRLVKSVPLTTNSLSFGTDLQPGIYFLKVDGVNIGKVVKVGK